VMEIWTNGTLTPEMALVEAAKILRKHLNPFVQYFELSSELGLGGDQMLQQHAGGGADASMLSRPITDLDLSARASNCLLSANISTIGELLQWDEPSLLKLRSFGKTSLREVKRKLADLSLSLKSDGTTPSLDDLDDLDDDAEELEGEEEAGDDLVAGGDYSPPPIDAPTMDSMGTPPTSPGSFGTHSPDDAPARNST